MADTSTIEWTDATWNPVTGCSVVSPGCRHCYAMRLAGGRLRHHPSRVGLTRPGKAGPVWTGEVRLNAEWLDQPLRWRRPRMIFVCAHGDLFHEAVPDEWIDRVFAVMALAPRHTFQILTKRSARMRAYIKSLSGDDVMRRCDRQARLMGGARRSAPLPAPHTMQRVCILLHEGAPGQQLIDHWGMASERDHARAWPLPNVWLGVSAERQEEADERIPDLLATPAAIRFVSAEPLLGPINLEAWLDWPDVEVDADPPEVFGAFWGCQGCDPHCPDCPTSKAAYRVEEGPRGPDGVPKWVGAERVTLDWIIVGGESGAGARPMHPDWARSLRDQCAAARVPFFFKQWGAWSPLVRGEQLRDGEDYTVKRWPDGSLSLLSGKAAAGRLLDGLEHDAMPERAA